MCALKATEKYTAENLIAKIHGPGCLRPKVCQHHPSTPPPPTVPHSPRLENKSIRPSKYTPTKTLPSLICIALSQLPPHYMCIVTYTILYVHVHVTNYTLQPLVYTLNTGCSQCCAVSAYFTGPDYRANCPSKPTH